MGEVQEQGFIGVGDFENVTLQHSGAYVTTIETQKFISFFENQEISSMKI